MFLAGGALPPARLFRCRFKRAGSDEGFSQVADRPADRDTAVTSQPVSSGAQRRHAFKQRRPEPGAFPRR